MRRKDTPDERGLCLYILRSLCGWTQEEMAKAVGTAASALSEYETGKRYTPERIVRRAAGKVGISSSTVTGVLAALEDLRSALRGTPPPQSDPLESLAEELYLELEDLAHKVVETVLASSRAWTSASDSPRDLVPPDVLWAELEHCGADERRLMVEEGVEYQTWSLCKLLCAKSLEAGEREALGLAELALHVAERIPGGEELRACAQAFAWAHLGCARRTLGDRSGAEEALARFRRLWHPEAPLRPLPLDDVRAADLEALASGEIRSRF